MLTQNMIDRAQAPSSGHRYLRDDKVPGLSLRVSASGVKAFVWEKWIPAKERARRITLGKAPSMSLGLARSQALAHSARVAAGEEPVSPRSPDRQRITFGELAQRYMDDHAKARKRSWAEDARMLRDVLPREPDDTRELAPAPIPAAWRMRRLRAITHEDVAQLHARLGPRGHYAANRVLALLRSMFSLARAWGLVTENPAARGTGLKPYKEEKRERFISVQEMTRVLAAIEAETDPRWRAFFLLSLLLGPRKGELLGARWEDVDLDGALWQKPMTKSGRSHLLPLPAAAVAILEALPRYEDSPWIFHSETSASGHLEEPRAAWARLCARAKVENVRIHDLRRTVGSWLAASGHSLPLIGKVLGHSQPAATAIYARLDVEPVRRALEANAQLMLGPGRAATITR